MNRIPSLGDLADKFAQSKSQRLLQSQSSMDESKKTSSLLLTDDDLEDAENLLDESRRFGVQNTADSIYDLGTIPGIPTSTPLVRKSNANLKELMGPQPTSHPTYDDDSKPPSQRSFLPATLRADAPMRIPPPPASSPTEISSPTERRRRKVKSSPKTGKKEKDGPPKTRSIARAKSEKSNLRPPNEKDGPPKTRSISRAKSEKNHIRPPKSKKSPKSCTVKSLHARAIAKSSLDDRKSHSEEFRKDDKKESGNEEDRRKSENLLELRSPATHRREKARSRSSNDDIVSADASANAATNADAKTTSSYEKETDSPRPTGKRRSKTQKMDSSKSLKETDSPRPTGKRRSKTQKTDSSKSLIEIDSPKPPGKRRSKTNRRDSRSRSRKDAMSASFRSFFTPTVDEKHQSRETSQKKPQRPKPQRQKSSSKKVKSKSSRMIELESFDDSVVWKRPSPHQEQRKKSRSQTSAQVDEEAKTSQSQNSTQADEEPKKSPRVQPKKTKSRKNMMLSSKATTDSCRNLLRKIDDMNTDRLSIQKISEADGKEEHKNSAPTQSTSDTDEEADSSSNSKPLLEEAPPQPTISKPKDRDTKKHHKSSGKSRSKPQKERTKPVRTSSAPLSRMGIIRSKSLGKDKLKPSKKDKSSNPPPTKVKKRSLSGGLQKLGLLLEGKGSTKDKNSPGDETIRTGNGLRRLAPRRTKSDSQIKAALKFSRYDLMVSNHSISGDFTKDDGHQSDLESDNDDDDSFGGDVDVGIQKDVVLLDSNLQDLEQTKAVTFTSPDDDDITNISGDSNSMASEMTGSDRIDRMGGKSQKLSDQMGGNNKKLSDHMSRCEVIVEKCDDILSMAEFTEAQIATTFAKFDSIEDSKAPKKPQSCLQIDFSELSEHGTSGNIIVRSQEIQRSGRRIRAHHSPVRAE